MVIAFHMIAQSDVLDNCSISNYVFSVFFHAGGRLACSVFVIIGAYFLVDIPFHTYRIAHLFIKTIITVAIIDFALLMFSENLAETVSITELIIQIFPIIGKPYWFIDAYIYMLILSPILNFILQKPEMQNYRYFLIVLSVAFILVGSWPATFELFPFSNDAIWFCFLYLLTGELKHHEIFNSIKKSTWAALFLICYLFSCGVSLVCNHLKSVWEYAWILRFFYISTYQSVFAFVAAVSLFGFFLHINISNNKLCAVIGKISSHTFGIFLIHQVPLLWLNGWLWNQVFHIKQYAYQSYFPAWCFLSLCICFFMCFIADLLLERLYDFLDRAIKISQLANKMDKYIGEALK